MIYRKFSILLLRTRYYMMDLHNSYRPCKGRAAKEEIPDGGEVMKRQGIWKTGLALVLAIGILIAPAAGIRAQAAEVIATVYGSVMSGTTSDLLLLSTKEGKMEIKLDAATDASACKVLLPGREISVAVTAGTDGYLHAARIGSEKKKETVTVDTDSAVIVKGELDDRTTEDMLYLKTPQGDMQIKLDDSTSMQGCSVLVIGGSYQVSCARGSDAYMHAVSISDAATGTSTAPGSGTGTGNSAYPTVTGTVDDRTKESLLYLSTDEGTMQFVIDNSADTKKGMMLLDGNKLTVAFYHGSDGYLHAVGLYGEKSSSSAYVNTSSTVTVSGTVNGKSDENMLYLDTPQGRMELKLDAVQNLNNCKVLTEGKKISVDCGYGSDAYLHAVNITAQ